MHKIKKLALELYHHIEVYCLTNAEWASITIKGIISVLH